MNKFMLCRTCQMTFLFPVFPSRPIRCFIKPPAAREARKPGVIVFIVQKICLFVFLLLCLTVQSERIQRIKLKFSLKLPTMPLHHVHHVSPCRFRTIRRRFSTFLRPDWHQIWCWPRTNSSKHYTISGSTESAVESDRIDRHNNPSTIFNNFLARWTLTDVAHVQTVLNIVRFTDPPNQPSNQYRTDDLSKLQQGV